MWIYADTNVFARPFDDQSQPRIALESEACLLIWKIISENKLSLVTSDILKLEIERTIMPKKIKIKSFLQFSKKNISQSEKVLSLAKKISRRCKIPPRDSLHLASAKIGQAKYFLTCDDDILKKNNCLENYFSIKVLNPIQFVWLKKL